MNPHTTPRQDRLFDVWRYQGVFVTSRVGTIQAESQHRDHAITELVITDAAVAALAHLPSGSFAANNAWAVLWAIAHNTARAAGALAGSCHARATTATTRAHLIHTPARLVSARRLTLPFPEH